MYAVGHTAITMRGRWMAAVLASGDGAVLSHRSATALWGIWGSGAGEVHVTVPRKTRPQGSIRRRYGVLPRDEVTVHDGIPVTSAARAVLDLAADRGAAAAEAALRETEYLGIYGPVSIPALLERHPRHRGAASVAGCLERLRDDPGGRIRSPLEELFLPFLDAHRIPRPRLNAWLTVGEDRFQVDCLWPDARLAGELRRLRVPWNQARLPQGPQARSTPRGAWLHRRPRHRRPGPRRTRGACGRPSGSARLTIVPVCEHMFV
ncbi:MAG: hypothetical protein QM729_18645 [Solirubrobacterales bacterium]